MLGAWLKRLETQHPKAMDLGLDRLREVWRALGAPWPGAQVVTVAGTNGKGSTIAFMRAGLVRACIGFEARSRIFS